MKKIDIRPNALSPEQQLKFLTDIHKDVSELLFVINSRIMDVKYRINELKGVKPE